MNLWTDWVILSGFVLGSILGSLIKVLADRSLTQKTFFGRSYCLNCKNKLKFYDLIPIISYLILKGRCRYCKTKLSIEYLLVEITVGMLVAFVFFQNIPNNFFNLFWSQIVIVAGDSLFKVFIVSVLMVAFLTDLKKGIIPDRITYPASFIALVFLIIFTAFKIGLIYLSLKDDPLGKYLLPPHSAYFVLHSIETANPILTGILCAAVLSLFFGSLIIITRGRGMGGGDLKLSFFMGLTLGFPKSILAVLLAFLSGSIVGVFLLLIGKKHLGQTIPFGPFLTLGSLIALFWGEKIISWYLHLSYLSF